MIHFSHMFRKQKDQILKDITNKIVFITGPRQVGKTWLSMNIAEKFKNSVYLNYDRFEDRKIIETEGWLPNTEFLILDELHKMPDWNQYLKGVFDTKKPKLKILVTISARLDFFRQTGDSLAGRFFTHRLYPFSLGEIEGTGYAGEIERLMARGGFPEPFLTDEETDSHRWRNHYIDGLIREDVLNFEKITDFKSLQLVLELLRNRVGSPISYTSIAGDVGIAPNTVKKYIHIFESLYIVFRVTPYSGNIARSLLKEPKIYFYDTGMVKGDEGVKFENLAALSFAKDAAAQEDLKGVKTSLHYLKTKEGKEVDFCYVENKKPRFFAEVKLSDNSISKNLLYFCEKYNIPGIQLVKNLKRERKEGLIEIREAVSFLKEFF